MTAQPTAPALIYFNLAAAEAAEDREENGVDLLPGDRKLIDALDGWRSQQWDAYWQPIWEAEDKARLAEWLATQCGDCEDGGTGELCDEHRPTTCTACGWKTWDALDLQPGDSVCVCADPFADAAVAA
jgi:hypothetical protein